MRNLFNELFTFRAKENFSAKENFLTESFAYFLQRNKKVCEAFVERVLGYHVEVETGYELTTRLVETLANKICFPDLRLVFRSSDGVRFAILSEHKWDSKIRPDQFIDYETALKSMRADEKRLVTVVERADQKRAAETASLSIPTTHLLWEDVYEILRDVDDQDLLLSEFADFMKSKKLNPGPPIKTETMQAFLVSVTFKPQLLRYADKLLNEYDWSIVPKAYCSKPEVRDRYGRITLEFKTVGWNPTLTIGFLYEPSDHLVTFTTPGESIDLFLRIEADPNTNKDAQSALDALRQKAEPLRLMGSRVLLRDDPGNGNRYSLLIVQESLLSAIGKLNEERAQVEVIYNKLHGWVSSLFKDGDLEKVLSNLKLFSLATDPSELTTAPEPR